MRASGLDQGQVGPWSWRPRGSVRPLEEVQFVVSWPVSAVRPEQRKVAVITTLSA